MSDTQKQRRVEMTRTEAIRWAKDEQERGAEYVTYGAEGGDYGTPVAIEDAIKDIKAMDDDAWGRPGDANIDICDCDGNIL